MWGNKLMEQISHQNHCFRNPLKQRVNRWYQTPLSVRGTYPSGNALLIMRIESPIFSVAHMTMFPSGVIWN